MFAKVLSVEELPEDDRFGGFMVYAITEEGYWASKYRFRVFPEATFLPAPGDKIAFVGKMLNESYCSAKYLTRSDFISCEKCLKYMLPSTVCSCHGEEIPNTKRISGEI